MARNKIAFVICMIGIAALIGCAAPNSIPPKPANLQATDSEYYSMYYTYNQWFPDSFNTDFENATKLAIANNWSGFWMGDTNDTSKRIHFQSSDGMWTPVSEAEAEPEDGTPPTTSTFPYSGTYIGMFTYEYSKGPLWQFQSGYNGPEIWSQWETDAFRLTVTFAPPLSEEEEQDSDLKDELIRNNSRSFRVGTLKITRSDSWRCPIVSVACSDAGFGCGLGSIRPLDGSEATLPQDPPTTPSNPSNMWHGIQIKFPNGASLDTYAGSSPLSVSSNGMTLSNSLDPGIQNATWGADSVVSGNLVGAGNWSVDEYVWDYHFKSWNLTKSAR